MDQRAGPQGKGSGVVSEAEILALEPMHFQCHGTDWRQSDSRVTQCHSTSIPIRRKMILVLLMDQWIIPDTDTWVT